MDLITILLATGLLMLAFALIAVRLILIKGGEYKAACSSNKEDLRKMGVDCPVCGNDPDKCERPEEEEQHETEGAEQSR